MTAVEDEVVQKEMRELVIWARGELSQALEMTLSLAPAHVLDPALDALDKVGRWIGR